MGTRGVIGFYSNGKGKVTYNHFDSYPSGIGVFILNESKSINKIKDIKKIIDKIKLINNSELKPTIQEIKKYKNYSDLTVGDTDKAITYYQLLRKIQGTLKPYIDNKVDIMINSEDFLKDSLFCEWGYIINLDTNKLEIYRGFNTVRNPNNRYKLTDQEITELKTEGEVYYPCELIKEYDLNKLPSKEQFLNDLKDDD